MIAFWKRECRGYFQSLVGYIFIAGVLCVIGANTYLTCLAGRIPSYETALASSALVFLLMVPILTMRLFSEDRKDNVLLFFYSLPLRLGSLVLGKYLALLTILVIPLVISVVYPLILSAFGTLSVGIIASTYLGFFAMGAALLSIGLFFAALLENQVAASAVTFIVLLASYLMPTLAASIPNSALVSLISLAVLALIFALIWFLLTRSWKGALIAAAVVCVPACLVYFLYPAALEGLLSTLMGALSVYSRFASFEEGILDLTALIYYVTLTALMLFLTVQVLESRRFR